MSARKLGVGTLIMAATERGFDPAPYIGSDASEIDLALPGPLVGTSPAVGLQQDLDAHRLSNNLANTYRRRSYAGGYCLPGEITIVAGAGGYGKTMWVLLLLLQLASGKRLLNHQRSPKLTAVFVSLEEPRAELLHKLRAIVKHLGLRAQDVEDLIVYGNDDPIIQALTCTGPRGQPMVNEPALQALERVISDTGAGVVAIDCVAPLAPVGANENGLVYSLITRTKVVLQRHDSSLVLIAHTRKGAHEDVGQDAVSGASAWVNGARVMVWVKPASSQEADDLGVPFGQEKSIRKVVVEKANYSPQGGEAYVQMVSVTMHPATADYPEDSVGIIVPFKASPGGRQYPLGMLREMVEIVSAGTPAGPFSPTTQSKGAKVRPGGRYPIPVFLPVVERHVGLKGEQARGAAKSALQHLIDAGWLVVGSHKDKANGNTRKSLTVAWKTTPWAADPQPAGAYVA